MYVKFRLWSVWQRAEGPKLIPWQGSDFFFHIIHRPAVWTIWHPVQWVPAAVSLPGSVRTRSEKVITHFHVEQRFMRGAAPPSSWFCKDLYLALPSRRKFFQSVRRDSRHLTVFKHRIFLTSFCDPRLLELSRIGPKIKIFALPPQ
jgi:hypothetical protein